MRARSALALAALLAMPLLLAAAPGPDAPLASHAAGGLLSAQIEAVLDRVSAAPATAPRGVLPDPGAAAVAGGAGGAVEVHWLAGERSFTTRVAPGAEVPVDLDGDGAAELRVGATTWPARTLTVAGVAPAQRAWAAWLDLDGARVGLTGAGRAAGEAMVALAEGELRLQVRGPAPAWHAAFAYAGEARRTVAWVHEPAARGDLDVFVGHGYLARAPSGTQGGVRMLLVDGPRTHDLTLRDVPPGAQVAREAAGALLYRAPRAGGALAYGGDADAVGQRGDLSFTAEPLPDRLAVAPAGAGFRVEASRPADVLFDWRPPGGEGLRFVANGLESLAAAPGAAGGIALEGRGGAVVVQRPAPEGAAPAPVDLAAQGIAVAPASPLGPGLVAVALGAAAWWALRGAPRHAPGPLPLAPPGRP